MDQFSHSRNFFLSNCSDGLCCFSVLLLKKLRIVTPKCSLELKKFRCILVLLIKMISYLKIEFQLCKSTSIMLQKIHLNEWLIIKCYLRFCAYKTQHIGLMTYKLLLIAFKWFRFLSRSIVFSIDSILMNLYISNIYAQNNLMNCKWKTLQKNISSFQKCFLCAKTWKLHVIREEIKVLREGGINYSNVSLSFMGIWI